MSEALEIAKRGLQFEDIYQERVDSWLTDQFDPRNDLQSDEIAIQLRHQVIKSAIIGIQLDEEAADEYFRVFTAVGVRIRKAKPEDSEAFAQIECTYRIDYKIINSDLKNDESALDEFAIQNSSCHLWPFWREFLLAQAARMNLPKIPLPLRVIETPSNNIEMNSNDAGL